MEIDDEVCTTSLAAVYLKLDPRNRAVWHMARLGLIQISMLL